ncbi:MAG TPA: MFS transporter, partial [Planctomycetes bacterium]|nr:MFS transporter [Planctomycetota bacterium]
MRRKTIKTTRPWCTRGVVAIGLASLLSDISHEMATAILPAFLVAIGGSAAALGLVEGVADFFSSAAKLAAGYFGDRTGRKKYAAGAGYVITAVAKGSMALATVWPHILLARTAGWIGRGLRSPLRDALLSQQVSAEHFGKAYGLERALDSAGAVIGPLVTVCLLWLLVPLRTIFLVTLVPGLAAAWLIVWGVRERPVAAISRRRRPAPLSGPFARFLLAVGLFGCGDFSRTFLILWATARQARLDHASGLTVPILLYVAYNLIASVSSYYSGRRSDRVGRKPVLAVGYLVGTAVSVAMAFDVHTLPVIMLVFLGSGVYMGIQEAVERAAAADLVPEAGRSFGFGVLATVNGLGDLAASAVVGLLWTY